VENKVVSLLEVVKVQEVAQDFGELEEAGI
jgi:hypothetical protein